MISPRLRITEIFLSLQGETRTTGLPTVFVRLTGCPLRCSYCDTSYAFQGGSLVSIEQIMRQVADYGVEHVTVTGGEPLAQPDVLVLLRQLCDAQYRVSLETGGALSVAEVDKRVVKILDLKTPGSGESARNLYENIEFLTAMDEVKFVICDRRDYDWSKQQIQRFKLHDTGAELLLSPVTDRLAARELAEWIIADRLKVRMQIQLHKLLWGNEKAR